jgi:hypothetical protein
MTRSRVTRRRSVRAARTTRWLLALLLLLLAGAAPADELQEASPADEILAGLSPELAGHLQQDKMVMLQQFGQDGRIYGGMIYALVLFERSRSEVMRFLIQSERQTEFRPELRRAEVVREFPGGHVVDYEIRMMLTTVRYRSRRTWDLDTAEMRWSLDPEADNDFAALEGHWELFELGPERTLARFGTKIDVGPALPKFFQDFATRRKLPESMRNVRLWIESGGSYRP